MAEPGIMAIEPPEKPAPGYRPGRLVARILSGLLLALLLFAALGYGAIRWLDSESGRAFVVRQLPLIKPEIGLTLRAGRIDGSIFGKAVIHDLQLGDPKGVFAVVPRLDLDWRPVDLIKKTLTIRSITTPEMRFLRRPSLLPSSDPRILPDLDIAIGRLKIDRLVLEPPVSGQYRVLGVGGNIDIRSGRAKVDLVALTLGKAGSNGSGDTIRLKLDAEPDNDKFDMDAVIAAPAGGAVAGLLGLSKPLDVTLRGDGSWRNWQGRLDGRLGNAPLVDLAISGKSGLFSANGKAMPAALLSGAPARLLGPVMTIAATAKIENRNAIINARLASRALTIAARGGLDFSDESIDNAVINAALIDPAAVSPQLRGRDIKLTAKIAGSFADPLVDYQMTATTAAWAGYTATNVRAAGIVRAGARPLVVPISLTAARVTGAGASVDPLLTNIRIDGPFTFGGGKLASNGLRFQSAAMNGTATAAIDFASAGFVITVNGKLPRFAIPGLGLADLGADLRIASVPGGSRISGPVSARVTRLDNSALATLTGGLPSMTAVIDVAPDLSMQISTARLTSPGLALVGNGSRSAAGIIRITATGNSRDYGPVSIAVAGPATAPVIDIKLAQPGLGVGLADVAARIAPAQTGWSFTVQAASNYGPIGGAGLIHSSSDPLAIDITRANVAGLNGRGRIVQTASGPFAGRIDFDGPGVDGIASLSAEGTTQRIDATIDAKDARLAIGEPVTIDSGSIKLTALLPRGGSPSARGNFDLAGVERDGLRIDRTQGSLNYTDGRGSAKVSASGSTAIPFSLSASAELAPDRIEILAKGLIDGKSMTMSGPAIITRGLAGTREGSHGGWSLAPFSIITPDGKAEISGAFGAKNAIHARFDRVSMALLTIAWPSIDVSGYVSGTVDIALPQGGVPTGSAALRLNNLSRAGLASASLPIDIGLNAELTANGASARAVILRGGKVEGRAQAHLGQIAPGSEPLIERVLASQVMAQLRYNGPAQALWGLSGIEAIDVQGPLSIVADISGQLGTPRLTGSMRSEGARVESTALGAVFDKVSLDSRFTNSRLELIRFSGRAGQDGSFVGTGGIDLSAERSFPIDVRVQLKNAKLANRDDFNGTATGNIRIATDEYGGVFSGKLHIDRATYRIGRSNFVAVPTLVVTEKNTKVLGRRAAVYVPPTRWLLSVELKADRRLFLSGMGLESEWRADVKVKGPTTAPELTGRVDLVRGDYDFAGKRFSLTRGSARFQGIFPPDPQIDISATSSQSGFTAQLDVGGTAQRPTISFSSVPALPEDEVLSRVLFGTSVTDLSAPEAVQLAAALASLRGGGGGFNPINAVRKGLGIDRLRILPADSARGRGTAIAAGQYIGRNVYVELVTDAQGYTATNIEVSLTRSLSILSSLETLGGTSVNLRWKRDY